MQGNKQMFNPHANGRSTGCSNPLTKQQYYLLLIISSLLSQPYICLYDKYVILPVTD